MVTRHPHRRPRSRQPAGRPPVACATTCAECAPAVGATIGDSGYHLALIHASHIPELEELGWRAWPHGMYDDGAPDVACPHVAPLVR